MRPTSSPTLTQRLLHAEQEFLSTHDANSLERFEGRWEALCRDFEAAWEAGEVDSHCQALAQSVFSRVALLGEDFLSLHQQEELQTTMLLSEVEEMFSQMTLGELVQPTCGSPSVALTSSRRKRSGSATGDAPSPPPPTYIPQAYLWMVENLHNPYPSSAQKAIFASGAAISPRSMNDWFKSMRRFIGWNTFVKRHFGGSRTLAVAAARRISPSYKISDIGIPSEIAADYMSMKTKLANFCREVPVHHRTPISCRRSPTSIHKSSYIVESPVPTSTDLPDSPPSSPPSQAPSLVCASSDSEDDERSSPICPTWLMESNLNSLACSSATYQDQTRYSPTLCADLSELDPQYLPPLFPTIEFGCPSDDPQRLSVTPRTAATVSSSGGTSKKKRRRSDAGLATNAKRFRFEQVSQRGMQTPQSPNHPYHKARQGEVFSPLYFPEYYGGTALLTPQIVGDMTFDHASAHLTWSNTACNFPFGLNDVRHLKVSRTMDDVKLTSEALSFAPLRPDLPSADDEAFCSSPRTIAEVLDTTVLAASSGVSPSGEEAAATQLPLGSDFGRVIDLREEQREEYERMLLMDTESANCASGEDISKDRLASTASAIILHELLSYRADCDMFFIDPSPSPSNIYSTLQETISMPDTG